MTAFVAVLGAVSPEILDQALHRAKAALFWPQETVAIKRSRGLVFAQAQGNSSRINSSDDHIDALAWCDGIVFAPAGATTDWSFDRAETWQANCNAMARLDGHAVLGLWQADQHTAVIQRSHGGEVGCYFAEHQGLFAIASEASAVLAALGLTKRINEASALRFFALLEPRAGECWLAGVRVLAPGARLQVRVPERTGEPFVWEDSMFSNPSRARTQAVADAVREIPIGDSFRLSKLWFESVTTAVRECIAPEEKAAVSLSGGLDSTLLAAALKAVQPHTACGVSWSVPQIPSADERRFVEATAHSLRIQHVVVEGVSNDWDFSNALRQWPMNPDAPISNPYRTLRDRVERAAAVAGYSVVLNGNFGDHLYAEYHLWLEQARLRGQFTRGLWQLLKTEGLKGVWRDAGMRFFIKSRLGLNRKKTPVGLQSDMTEEIQNDQTNSWQRNNPSAAWDAALDRHWGRGLGVCVRMPYRHPVLLAFAEAIRADQWHPGGVHKGLTRLALQHVGLDDLVRLRPKSGSLLPILHAGLRQMKLDAERQPELDPRFGLSHSLLKTAWERFETDESAAMLCWMASNFESWSKRLA